MSDSTDNKWFEKLRVNSWEIEILIVACILAALFNLPEFTEEKLAALEVSTHFDQRANTDEFDDSVFWLLVGMIKMFMYSAVNVFIGISKITFSLYIFFRGFWVAVIGLSSVFSNGINVKGLRFSSYFNKLLPDTSFDNYILRLDNICSSVFSLGFLVAFFYVSILIFFSVCILFLGSIEYFSMYFFESLTPETFTTSIAVALLVFGLIFFLDILFLGIFKRVKWKVFSYPYSKIYSFFRIITCFFLYESIYYLLISNVKRRVILIFLGLIFLFIGFSIFSNKGDGYLKFPSLGDSFQTKSSMSKNYYEDRLLAAADNFSSTQYPFINSEIISESYLRLYIPFHPSIHSSLDSACGITNQILAGDQNIGKQDQNIGKQEILLDCINNVYAIYVDNDTIVNDFVFYNYSSEDASINTFFMPIAVSDYADGKHVITVEKLFAQHYRYPEEDSIGQRTFVPDDIEMFLSKDNDSLIHIPFYIYR